MKPKPPKRTRRQVQTGMESSSDDEEPAQKAQATAQASQPAGNGPSPLAQQSPLAKPGKKLEASGAAAAAAAAALGSIKDKAVATRADLGRHASSSPTRVMAAPPELPDNHHHQQKQQQQQQEQPNGHSCSPVDSHGPSAAPATPAAPSSSRAAVHSKQAPAAQQHEAALTQQAGQATAAAAAVSRDLPASGAKLPGAGSHSEAGLPLEALHPSGPTAAAVAARLGVLSIPQAVAGLKRSLGGLTAAIEQVNQAADALLVAAEAVPPVGHLGALRDHLQQVLTRLNAVAPP